MRACICDYYEITRMLEKFCQVQRVRSVPLSVCDELSRQPTIMFPPPGDGTDLLSMPHWLDHLED